MGRRGYQGESARDRATNIMDKFIQRNERKKEQLEVKSIRRKDPNIPFELWPLKDQIEFYDNMSESERFDRKYTYSSWYKEILNRSGMYPITFRDCVSTKKEYLRELFSQRVNPRDAMEKLRKENIIH